MASAHGLGQLQAPYDEKKPAKGIPGPRVKLHKLGVQHWHHDLWWLIATAAIDGHPDVVKFNHHPALRKPAASRYAATTPKYLRWFDKYNDGLPYAQKLKPFGFVSAFSARPLIEQPLSKSRRTRSKANKQLKPVAPFDKKSGHCRAKFFRPNYPGADRGRISQDILSSTRPIPPSPRGQIPKRRISG
jgi:hypothetical protein